jgi:hypothetical protein
MRFVISVLCALTVTVGALLAPYSVEARQDICETRCRVDSAGNVRCVTRCR